MSLPSASDPERARQRELVRAGYDAISRAYRDDEGNPAASSWERTETYEAWLEDLLARLPRRPRVLDVGCGAGVPASRLLVASGCRVTGVDISAVQVERARALVPDATFVQADMATWDCPRASIEAIVTLYALIHVPLEDQQRLIPRMAEWLVPGGYLLAIVGHERWTGVEDYLGALMFWDHADAATYRRWLRDAGFTLIWDRFVPEGPSGHTLLLAQASRRGTDGTLSMAGDAEVRRFVASDSDACLRIVQGLPEFFTADVPDTVARELSEHRAWVVTEGGTVAGFAIVATRGTRGAEILWAAVEASRRGQGLGARLIERVLHDVSAGGVRVVLVKTLDASARYQHYEATRAFWERHGFVQVDTIDPLPGWQPGNPSAIYVAALGPTR